MDESILIIEDNASLRENASEILKLANYNVLSAENGIIGVELARQHKPNLILCDIVMPELDGYGVLQILENNEDLLGIPFVFISAKSDKKDFRKAMDMGADDYLMKPFDGDDLLRVVSSRLKKSGQIQKKNNNSSQGLNDFMNDVKSLNDIVLLSEQKVAKKIKAKETLFMEGDIPSNVYFVVSGKIKTYKTNEDGKDYITEIFKEGDFFGYVDLLDNSKHKESAMTIENSEITSIPKQDFFKLLYSNNDIAIKFIKMLSNNLCESEQKLLKLAYNSARKKVAEALLFIYRKYKLNNVDDPFPVNRENLSSLAGISPESVSRNLTDFREEELIESSNGNIRIINLKKLESLRC